jgi:hypothetical protein
MTILIMIAVVVFAIYLFIEMSDKTDRGEGQVTCDRQPIAPPQKPVTIPDKPRSDNDLSDIEINDDFKAALELIEGQNENVYVTGKAGTGKSTFLKYLRATTRKNVVVLAPTGLSAINVGGQTIHSLFGLPPKLINVRDIRPSKNSDLYQKLDAVIIDEVSMVRADLMDGIDYSLRINRKKNEPFGGVQMIFIGDLFQLPPIVRGRDLEDFFNHEYGGPYFFCSKAFKNNSIRCVDLKKIYRQSDSNFIDLLNSVREDRLTDDLLETLNSRVAPNLDTVTRSEYVTLTTTNQAAYEINETFLNSINEKEYLYHADMYDRFTQGDYPIEATLRLKRGARVMLLRNDPLKRWVNGTLAKIADLGSDQVIIDVAGSYYEIKRESWKKIEYYYDRAKKKIEEKVIASFEQYAIRLAWAITIHKSQGQTFNRVYIDLGRGAFTHGQTYVALSRCTSFDGIKLKRPVEQRDVIFDPRVYDYTKIMVQ